jgi:mannosyl-oligosaccharide alpha-1,2-mannosidase
MLVHDLLFPLALVAATSSLHVSAESVKQARAGSGTVQKAGLQLPSDAATNRQLVKTVFLDAYSAYKQYAWKHDDLAPISASFKDTRNGWGSTVFDAMGTLKIMGEDVSVPEQRLCLCSLNSSQQLFNEAIAYAAQVDFSHSNTQDHVSYVRSATARRGNTYC